MAKHSYHLHIFRTDRAPYEMRWSLRRTVWEVGSPGLSDELAAGLVSLPAGAEARDAVALVLQSALGTLGVR